MIMYLNLSEHLYKSSKQDDFGCPIELAPITPEEVSEFKKRVKTNAVRDSSKIYFQIR